MYVVGLEDAVYGLWEGSLADGAAHLDDNVLDTVLLNVVVVFFLFGTDDDSGNCIYVNDDGVVVVVVFFLFGYVHKLGYDAYRLDGCSVLLVWLVLFCCVRCCPYACSTIYVLLSAWGLGV